MENMEKMAGQFTASVCTHASLSSKSQTGPKLTFASRVLQGKSRQRATCTRNEQGRFVHLRSRGLVTKTSTIQSALPESVRTKRARRTHKESDCFFIADPQTGVAPEAWTPRPPYAFKISMFNVFCNSH